MKNIYKNLCILSIVFYYKKQIKQLYDKHTKNAKHAILVTLVSSLIYTHIYTENYFNKSNIITLNKTLLPEIIHSHKLYRINVTKNIYIYETKISVTYVITTP